MQSDWIPCTSVFGDPFRQVLDTQQFDYCHPYIRRIEPASEPEQPKRRHGAKYDTSGVKQCDWVEQFPGDLDPDACRELVGWMLAHMARVKAGMPLVECDKVDELIAKCRRTNNDA